MFKSTAIFLIFIWLKKLMGIICRFVWVLSEISIEIVDLFQQVVLKNTKNALIFTIFVIYGRLTNLFFRFGFDKVYQSAFKSDNNLES